MRYADIQVGISQGATNARCISRGQVADYECNPACFICNACILIDIFIGIFLTVRMCKRLDFRLQEFTLAIGAAFCKDFLGGSIHNIFFIDTNDTLAQASCKLIDIASIQTNHYIQGERGYNDCAGGNHGCRQIGRNEQ